MVDKAVFERIPPPVFGKENKMDPSGQHSPNVGAGFFVCVFKQCVTGCRLKTGVLEQWSVESSHCGL